MIKRLCFFIIFILVLSMGSISAFAEKTDDGAASSKVADQKADDQSSAPLIRMTKPDTDSDTTSNIRYTVWFVTNYDNVQVQFLRKQDDKYVEFKSTDGQSSFYFENSDSSKGKEFSLNKGKNEIKMIASLTTKVDGKEVVRQENHDFTVTCNVELTVEKAKTVVTDKTKTLNSISPFKK